MATMEYRVLGRLEALRDGEPVDLGAHRQRTLLAILLTNANGVVAMDEIIEALWGDDAGADRQNALWVYVSGLRKALEPSREKRTDGTVLLTRTPGYVLAADEDAIDAVRFEKLVAEGRSLGESDPAAASLVLGEALALWQGKPYEEFTYDSFFQNEIARLEELRLEAVEARVEADLQRGRAGELVSELESLVRQHPLRERLTGQLMLALYRSGRQAEALRAYQALQRRLGEELGIEPSASIRRLEEQIVTADAGLDSAASAASAGSGAEPGLTVRGYELRETIGEGAYGIAYRAYQPAVGREVAIKVIRPELADDPTFIRRFEAEAQLVARLEHPHIVPLYDYWREPGAAYLVMRLMKGGSLDDVLETSALTGDHAVRVAEQLAGALRTAHDHGVVHRDIKPSNILIDDDGNAYLSDFGIAVGADAGPATDRSISGTLTAPYASPEQLEEGAVSPESDVFSLGVVLAQAMTGMRGDVPQIRGALGTSVAAVIDKATDAVRTDRYADATSFVRDLRRSLGEEPVADDTGPRIEVENPYKGLRSFDATDATDFFGRERLIDRLLFRLSEPGLRGRFVALVGPSGGGKSSVVKAGLRPALAAGALPLSDEWFSVEMVPAPHPFEELESALLSVAVDPPALMLERLTSGSAGLHKAVAAVLPDDRSQLLLVIDQFEELFTQVDTETADRFLESLVEAVTEKGSRLRVVVTLRADFYDRPLRHRALGELLREGTEVITPMSADELERAITGPAERHGVVFEPALVARLIHDVADRPSVLPLLQYTLTELFEGRTTSRITAASYDDLGGVSGALVKRAEGLLTGLSSTGQEAARLALLRLVTLGEGVEDTRRRVLLSELEDLPVAPADLRAVLDTFGRHRLLSFDRDPVSRSPSVEIAHETMLTEWTRLRDWIDGARHDVRNQRRLAEAMAEWAAAGHDDAYLLRGGRLEQLHGWASSTSLPLSSPERAFLDASVAERARAAEDEREREQRAVDAELEARHRARQLAGAAVAGVLVAALAVFGFVQWQSAEDGRSEAEAARFTAESAQTEAETARAATEVAKAETDHLLLAADLARASGAVLDSDPELAALLGVAAVRETATLDFAIEDAVDALHWALQQLRVGYPVGADADIAVRAGPNGLTGVYLLPPADLVALAEDAVDRRLTDAECEAAVGRSCPEAVPIPSDIPLRFGSDYYGLRVLTQPGDASSASGPLVGTRVELASSSVLGLNRGLIEELDRFTDATGIRVVVPGIDDENNPTDWPIQDTFTRIVTGALGRTPDIATFLSTPPDWAQSQAIDLDLFLDEEQLRFDFGNYLIDAGSSRLESGDPEIAAIPLSLAPSGLVFYPKPAFEAAGYEIPSDWDELMALSQQMVDDGRTPWCLQWGGFVGPYQGSSLLSGLVLRGGGIEAYDSWVLGNTGFTAPAVIEAAEAAEQLIFSPGFVRGGPGLVSKIHWISPLPHLLETDPSTGAARPQCWLTHGDTQTMEFSGRAADRVLGVDIDYFMLPPPELSSPVAMSGMALYATAMSDRPEVRALMSFMASPTWGAAWARATHESETFLSANRRFDRAGYADEASPALDRKGPAEVALRVDLHDRTHAALESGTWRLDASALFPTSITEHYWQGMLDWVDEVKPIEEILADIEAARPASGA